ncbi:Holliday junction resolvase RuvX [Buchnera aphidicola (Hyadaphis tataricae)]|uniref:Putative pre-16S rRNA nuclease n=1 Tax=Buchnera aphidicola (Hyadaphis tataricae) TaxID=1241859 RepID=A0A4D6Y6T2_9GAMM|nr:Holliday junction resolvase RuvX [Buchnera aphidicola]QCI21821.1 Holliday junction resolvase RuvX [Buchnera aphidicola (Hyadaphis tataricae)]
MTIIAFDFGIKKIGIAVGENITKTGKPLNCLNAHCGTPNWNNIKKLLQYWKPEIIVVGLPLNMNGTKQDITKRSEKFAVLLKNKFNILVAMHDERLTTAEARSKFFENKNSKKLKNNIHSLSALIILESWLNQANI